MKQKYSEPFLKATEAISENYFGMGIVKTDYTLEKSLAMDREIIVAFAIKGDLQGLVIFGVTKEEAIKLSSHVLRNKWQMEAGDEWDDLHKSVLQEFGNTVVGYATELYGEINLDCDISTPKFIPAPQLANYAKESIRFEVKNNLATMLVKLHIEKKKSPSA